MQDENVKCAWLYARIPGNDVETLRYIRECVAKAQQDGCKIVSTSTDERSGWLLRPGYREMMRQVKAGKIDNIYVCRMRQISGKERHLFGFFQQVMQHGTNCPFRGKLRKMLQTAPEKRGKTSQTMQEKYGKMSQGGIEH